MTVITDKNRQTAAKLLTQLTLDEKIDMIHGNGLFQTKGVLRMGIPPLKMSDGPMGVRQEFSQEAWEGIYRDRDCATYLPCGSALASTWNPNLAFKQGQVLGQEARGRGKDIILGPSVNIKRCPLSGRNFEYLSEDPYLTEQMSLPYIKGVQESDVAACIKHFAANSQETDRLMVDESISERALREIYLPVFKTAVRDGGVLSLMGAYNLVNGERCCESVTLLDNILREEWGFNGVVISDWGGVFRTKESAEVSLDIEMSVSSNFDDYKFARPLKKAIETGKIPRETVDKKVFHILCLMDALHMLPSANSDRRTDMCEPVRKVGSYSTPEHRIAALDIARESIILLKNNNSLLPLKPNQIDRLLVIGANADRTHSQGGGSAEIKSLYEVSPLLGLCGLLGGQTEVTYLPGYEVGESHRQDQSWQAESLNDGTAGQDLATGSSLASRQLADEAVAQAAKCSHVLFIGGLDHDYDCEGVDRKSMNLPYGQDALIERLLEVNSRTILAFVGGSPVAMPWEDKAHAIVWSWYGGCEAGTALAEVLLGRINPSGHLPETFPLETQDCPAVSIGTFGEKRQVAYSEDIYVGYRYYESNHVPVRFCFGHGLTYTHFEYSDLDVSTDSRAADLTFSVTNTGEMAGFALPQVYLSLRATGEDRPEKELKKFTKIYLRPGQRQDIHLVLPKNQALRYWSLKSGRYEIAPEASVFVGESVQDIRLSAEIKQ